MKKILLSAFTLAIFLTSSCDDPSVEMFDCDTTPTYTAEVKAIIDASCATVGCHDVTTKANDMDLSTYATAEAASKNANFIGSVQRLEEYVPMPLGGAKLSAEKIETLGCWIQGGSPE